MQKGWLWLQPFYFTGYFLYIYQVVHIIRNLIFFNFSQNYSLVNLVHFYEIFSSPILWNLVYASKHMHCPPNSSDSFQCRSFLVYRIFVHLSKACFFYFLWFMLNSKCRILLQNRSLWSLWNPDSNRGRAFWVLLSHLSKYIDTIRFNKYFSIKFFKDVNLNIF